MFIGVQQILCCVVGFFLCLSSSCVLCAHVLPVFLDCPFLIAPLVSVTFIYHIQRHDIAVMLLKLALNTNIK